MDGSNRSREERILFFGEKGRQGLFVQDPDIGTGRLLADEPPRVNDHWLDRVACAHVLQDEMVEPASLGFGLNDRITAGARAVNGDVVPVIVNLRLTRPFADRLGLDADRALHCRWRQDAEIYAVPDPQGIVVPSLTSGSSGSPPEPPEFPFETKRLGHRKASETTLWHHGFRQPSGQPNCKAFTCRGRR